MSASTMSAADTMPDFTNYILHRRYKFLSMLGAGSFGVVYEVEDLCHGGDLFQQISLNRAFVNNDEHLRNVFLKLVDVVEACHKSNVYHRDLKPENIFTNEDGSEIFLADFGLATDLSVVIGGCGTESYMGSEVVGRMTDPWRPYYTRLADIWALGIILVNMITGQVPWTVASPEDYYFAQWLEDLDFLKRMLPMSDGANVIVQRLLELEPVNRISLSELRCEIIQLDTFFFTPEELDKASDYAQYVAATLGQNPLGRRWRVPIPPPQQLPLPDGQNMTVRTISDPLTPIARRRSFTAQPQLAIPGLYAAVEEDSSSVWYAADGATSHTSGSSSVVYQPNEAVKFCQETVIAKTFWDGKATQQNNDPSPVYVY